MKTFVYFFFIIIFLFSIKTFSVESINPYSIILSRYVKNGLVNYDRLKNDNNLYSYIEILKNTNPDTLSNNSEKLAFWINAYNAYTLKIILDNYPVESINDLNWGGLAIAQLLGKTIWGKDIVLINNKKISLDDIEHEIIRKNFNDPRIHFALVCAALSCPELRNEPYESEKLDAQLDDQAKKFINNKKKNYFDLKNKTAFLSQYFNWYGDDFGKNDDEILIYISNYLNDKEVTKSLLENSNQWEIKFIPYNWCLNKQNPNPDDRCVTDWDTVKEWFFGG